MIQLTLPDEVPVWVDPTAMQVVREFNSGTRITLDGGAIVQVTQSVDVVLEARRLALARLGGLVHNLTALNGYETKEDLG